MQDRTVRTAGLALVALFASACDQRSGQIFANGIVAFIYGAIVVFAAAIIVPIIVFMVLEAQKLRRAHRALMEWIKTAVRAAGDVAPGAPSTAALQPRVGTPYSVWVHYEFESTPGRFRFDVEAAQDDRVLSREGFDGSYDGEDHWGAPSYDGLLGFKLPDGRYIERCATFTFPRATPATLRFTFTPTGETRVRAASWVVLEGDPPRVQT